MSEISDHLCECGCGQYTKYAVRNDSRKKWTKGEPYRFVYGHAKRGFSIEDKPKWYLPNNNGGFCHCGCGEPCAKAKRSKRVNGVLRGEIQRYIPGHHPGRDFSEELEKTKTCSKCFEEKSLTKFNMGDGYADGYHNICKACSKKFPSQSDTARRTNTYAIRARNRKHAWEYLIKNPCVDCHEPDPVVLEFDHVRGEKKHNVSFLIHGSASIKTLQAEIDKCDVVCANCHRRRTAQSQEWAKSVSFRFLPTEP